MSYNLVHSTWYLLRVYDGFMERSRQALTRFVKHILKLLFLFVDLPVFQKTREERRQIQEEHAPEVRSQVAGDRGLPLESVGLWRDRDGDVAHAFWDEDRGTGYLAKVGAKELSRMDDVRS